MVSETTDLHPNRGYYRTHEEYMRATDPAVLRPDDFPETARVLGISTGKDET